jgi:hypothetical protein
VSDDPAPFPPSDLAGFLALCAGEWLALRSRFDLQAPELPPDPPAAELQEEPWHRSERGELVVEHLAPAAAGEIGGLQLRTADGSVPARLTFLTDGRFRGHDGRQGEWQLWPDGTLELRLSADGVDRQERIWFTKANLRLRSAIERHADGRPTQASFSSEIRRLRRPPA